MEKCLTFFDIRDIIYLRLRGRLTLDLKNLGSWMKMEKNLVAMVTEWAMEEMVTDGSVLGVRVLDGGASGFTARVAVLDEGWFTGGDLLFSVVDGAVVLDEDSGLEPDLMVDDREAALEWLEGA